MSTPLLQLQQVSFSHPGREVLTEVDFELGAGERVALLGANGAGKSTLLHLLVGLRAPRAGTVSGFGQPRRSEKDFRDLRSQVQLLFQDPDDQLFCPTVIEDVAFGPLNLGKSAAEATGIALATLEALGLQGFADRITHRLSGGEKRMVSLATVLAMSPKVLLLDEPTNGLDEQSEQRLLEHLQALPQAMLFVSHDRRLVERLATRAVILRDGRLSEAVIHSHPHTHTHSHLHVHAVGADAGHEHIDPVPGHRHDHGGDGVIDR